MTKQLNTPTRKDENADHPALVSFRTISKSESKDWADFPISCRSGQYACRRLRIRFLGTRVSPPSRSQSCIPAVRSKANVQTPLRYHSKISKKILLFVLTIVQTSAIVGGEMGSNANCSTAARRVLDFFFELATEKNMRSKRS